MFHVNARNWHYARNTCVIRVNGVQLRGRECKKNNCPWKIVCNTVSCSIVLHSECCLNIIESEIAKVLLEISNLSYKAAF